MLGLIFSVLCFVLGAFMCFKGDVTDGAILYLCAAVFYLGMHVAIIGSKLKEIHDCMIVDVGHKIGLDKPTEKDIWKEISEEKL